MIKRYMREQLQKIKEADYKNNLGYIVYLICINLFIIAVWYSVMNLSYLENVNNLSNDITNDTTGLLLFLSLFIMPVVAIYDKVLWLINFIMTSVCLSIFVLVLGIIFNKIYFKKLDGTPKEKRIIDIKVITLIISIVSLIIILAMNKELILGVIYLVLTIINYLMVKSRINKIHKNE